MITLPTRLDLFKLLPSGSVFVEVGVWRGYNAIDVLNNCPNVVKYYGVDSWAGQTGIYLGRDKTVEEHEADMAEAQHNLRGWIKNGRAEIIRGKSVPVAANFSPCSANAVYIDGDHSYEGCFSDLCAWSKRARGVLMGHDYCETGNAKTWNFGVVPAVRDFCKLFGWDLTHLTDEEFASFCLRKVQ